MKKVLYIIAVVAISIMNAVPVLAATTAIVSVYGVPAVSSGITSFNIIYVSDTEMDLNWTVDGTVANVMVRAKYGSYPADIPNENTTPSDGYLVYYGSGLSVSDTSMNFDQSTGLLYYKAWAQKADGTWYVVTSTGKKESKAMALLFILGFSSLISYFAIRNRNILMAVIGSALWILLLSYTRSNPISGTTTGSTADTLLVVVCIALTIAVPLISWTFQRQDRRREDVEAGNLEESKDKKNRKDYSTVVGANKNVNLTHMSDADYAEVLRGRRNRRK